MQYCGRLIWFVGTLAVCTCFAQAEYGSFERWSAGPGASIESSAAGNLVLSYDKPDKATVILKPDAPILMPEGVRRIRFDCARMEGDCDFSLLLVDARGVEHVIPTWENCATGYMVARQRRPEWSAWNSVESVNLALPQNWEERVLPEFQSKVDEAIWPRPLTFAGILLDPVKQTRDTRAGQDKAKIAAGCGKIVLTNLNWSEHDGLSATDNWYIRERFRSGWDIPPYLFGDDLSSQGGEVRYAIEVRKGYQGPVAFYQEGRASADRANPLAIWKDRIELPRLPQGRYFINTKSWRPDGTFDGARQLQLYVFSSPVTDLPKSPQPTVLLSLGALNEVLPSDSAKASIQIKAARANWPEPPLNCRVVVKDWRQRLVLERTVPFEPEMVIQCPGLNEGTDYQVMAEITAGKRVLDQGNLHFGVASAPRQGKPAPVPASVPSAHELMSSGRVVVIADHHGSYFSDRDGVLPPVDDKILEEHHAWMRSLPDLGIKYCSTSFEWSEINPLPGVYHWDELDKRVELAGQLGMQIALIPVYLDGHPFRAPLWVDSQLMLTQYGYPAMGSNRITFDSYYSPGFRQAQKEWLRAVAERYVDNPHVFYYRENRYGFFDNLITRPEATAGDYSPGAQAAFNEWLRAQGRAPHSMTPRFALPGADYFVPWPRINPAFRESSGKPSGQIFGSDLSQEWRDVNDFRVYTLRQYIKDIVESIRSVDPKRGIVVYNSPYGGACEAAIPELRKGGAFQHEGGPDYYANYIESMCLQAGVPYVEEAGAFVPISKAHVDGTLFYGNCLGKGWMWNYKWNQKTAQRPEHKGVEANLQYISKAANACAEFVAAHSIEPDVLVFGSHEDHFAGWERSNYFSKISGVEVFTSLFAFHNLPAHFTDEYGEWTKLDKFKLIFVSGEVMRHCALDRITAHAKAGGKVVLLGDAGRYCAEEGAKSVPLAKQLEGMPNVRRLSEPSLPAPEDVPTTTRGWGSLGVQMFDEAALEDVLKWAGVERHIKVYYLGDESLVRRAADGKTWYVALFRRPYPEDEWKQEQLDKRGRQQVVATVIGLPDGRYKLSQRHRVLKDMGVVVSQNGRLELKSDPMGSGEMQVLRLDSE